ncbi:hypothetical protein QFC20_004617 [Naganishia adeliensis]|uniref:Uncharacterized protein n=1 Tax=Naganishia adeliensis TaxID=92952 RepID=A0ACC2VYK7_9TREE|nr:hypothetical protein QFC20_004617 [Naganishia adeliensis]
MAEEPTPTSLMITTGGWELAVSVNMEKVPLKVYQETREERQTVCWVASEAGKPLEDHFYDRMTCQVLIDGQRCGSIWAKENPYTLDSTRVDSTRVQEWVFAQPRLDEEDSGGRAPGQPDLGAIVIQARRARAGATIMSGNCYKVQDSGSISEKTKKGILVAAVTAFREKVVAYTPPGIATTSERKPGDEATPMHTFRFNYAPEPVLLAQGLIPIKHQIAQGGAGRSAGAPIDLEDDAPRPSKDKKPRVEVAPQADDPDAREAALMAELERLRNKKRKALESIELSDEENESKAAVMRRIAKKLEQKKAQDGGNVDLTLDSD